MSDKPISDEPDFIELPTALENIAQQAESHVAHKWREPEQWALRCAISNAATYGWNESVKAHEARNRLLTCACCGEEFPPGTPPSNHEALTAHGFECAKSPIAQALQDARMERERIVLDLQ